MMERDWQFIDMSRASKSNHNLEKNQISWRKKPQRVILLVVAILPLTNTLCYLSGTKYGQGTYFARDASYSCHYARIGDAGGRYMYLARVLVGQYYVGNSTMIVPPPKTPLRPEILYESVVDNPIDPSIFVVFYDNQCYPEYLITLQ